MSPRDDRGPQDYEEYPQIRIQRPAKRHDWLAIGAFIASVAINVGSIAWWGGRIDQRVEGSERWNVAQDMQIQELRRDVARHDSAIAANNVAYSEIMRRLENIERKLDQR